jgi:UrcA family protein
MNKVLLGFGVGAAASILIGSVAVAEDVPEVVVSGKRVVVETPAGTDSRGFPLVDMSVSYGVSYAGVNLATASGAAELEKRVHDAANRACKEIGDQRPLRHFATSESECAKVAADNAMVKVHALVAEAEKKAVK